MIPTAQESNFLVGVFYSSCSGAAYRRDHAYPRKVVYSDKFVVSIFFAIPGSPTL